MEDHPEPKPIERFGFDVTCHLEFCTYVTIDNSGCQYEGTASIFAEMLGYELSVFGRRRAFVIVFSDRLIFADAIRCELIVALTRKNWQVDLVGPNLLVQWRAP